MWRVDRRLAGIGLAAVVAVAQPTRADPEMPVFRVEMRDGIILPNRITVPADTRFKIEIHNTGTSPVEFESTALKREKAVAAGDVVALVFRSVSAGEYDIADDFHPDAKAVLVAK